MDTEIKAMENAKIPEPEIQIRKKEFQTFEEKRVSLIFDFSKNFVSIVVQND